METHLQNIIEKVGALFIRYGIKSVTMDDIARHLGISKKTIYTYVKDKNELVEMVVNEQVNKHLHANAFPPDSNMNALDELLLVYKNAREMLMNTNPGYQYDLKKYYPKLCAKYSSFKKEHLFEKIKNNLIKGKKEGIYRAEINEDIIAHMHASRNYYAEETSRDEMALLMTPEAFRELFIYHMHAVLNREGLELLNQKNFFQFN
jgi:AcrR family transcriptional regulator